MLCFISRSHYAGLIQLFHGSARRYSVELKERPDGEKATIRREEDLDESVTGLFEQ